MDKHQKKLKKKESGNVKVAGEPEKLDVGKLKPAEKPTHKRNMKGEENAKQGGAEKKKEELKKNKGFVICWLLTRYDL
jgi:hypothetical protein